jgi:hypothetical protein
MHPELAEGEFVFCCVSPEQLEYLSVNPICQVREREGITLVLPRQEAEELQLDSLYISRMITLTVHSSLDAIGFLAAIMTKLAAHDISVNAVSAYYHDHLFIPADKAEMAMRLLQELAEHP